MGMKIKKVGVNDVYVIKLGTGDITVGPGMELKLEKDTPVLWLLQGRDGCREFNMDKKLDVSALPVKIEFSNAQSLDNIIAALDKMREKYLEMNQPGELIEFKGEKYRDQVTISTNWTASWWKRICMLFAPKGQVNHTLYVKQIMPDHVVTGEMHSVTYWDMLVAWYRDKTGTGGMESPREQKEATLEHQKNVAFTTATIKDTEIGPWLRMLIELEAKRKGILEEHVQFKYNDAMVLYNAHYTPYQAVRKLFKK